MPRIGFIYLHRGLLETPSQHTTPVRRIPSSALRDLGYVEGKNVLIERRYAEGRLDRMPVLVNELVQEKD